MGGDNPEPAEAGLPSPPIARYFVFWGLALIFSAAAFVMSGREVSDEFSSLHPYDEFSTHAQSLFEHWFPDSHKSGPVRPDASMDVPLTVRLQGIDNKLHPAPDLLEAGIQVSAVIFTSFLWFFAFAVKGTAQERLERENVKREQEQEQQRQRSGRRELAGATDKHTLNAVRTVWWPVVLSLIPVTLFVVTMHKAYQPAVFVMALVAILVAAEHYTGLMLQEQRLVRTSGKLEGLVGKLTADVVSLEAKTQGMISGSGEKLQSLVGKLTEDVKQLESKTQTILDDRGLSKFRNDVYRAYMTASVIYAVVRIHGVDNEWWEGAGDLREAWTAFEASNENRTDPTFLEALCRKSGYSLHADFVTDFPMPGSAEWDRRLAETKAPLFGDFLGFVWEYQVLLRAIEKSDGDVQLNAWVSRPLCWMHVTDSALFQVIQRDPRDESSVLSLVDLNGRTRPLSKPDIRIARDMIEWGQSDIRRYIRRSGPAEEYIIAVLNYVAVVSHASPTVPILGTALESILAWLGMERWIVDIAAKSTSIPVPEEKIRTIVLGLFADFLELAFRKKSMEVTDMRVGDLARGVL